MAREPEKVNSAYVRAYRGGINRQLRLDNRILLLEGERQRKYAVNERDESCTKRRDDLASMQIL